MCGYHGWFNCYGDGSAVERWVHWAAGTYKSNNGLPAPGHLSFELYPDISDYNSTSLFQTAFDNLGDGQPSLLFSSYKQDVIEKHFEWMKQYEIDGVGVQKFLPNDGVLVKNRDSIAMRVRKVAEKYQRVFYIIYDMSASDSATFCNDLLRLESYKLTSSSYYAHENGKPVICIWEFGLNSRPDLPITSLNLIYWLKGKGYYVIGGMPTYWRIGTGDSWADYINVNNAFDMISPWAVGRFNSPSGADNYHTNVPVSYSLGPVFFRTSMEVNYDAVPTWSDQMATIKNVVGYGGTSVPHCSLVNKEVSRTGAYSLKYSGRDNSTTESYCYFNVFDVNFPVYSDTKLTFWNYPLNNNGRFVSVDLLMTDGTRLIDTDAKDISGLSMVPSQGRGTVNAWTENVCNIGQWLIRKTMDKILVGYDQASENDDFSGNIDDIFITPQGVYKATALKYLAKMPVCPMNIYPNPVKDKKLLINFVNFTKEPEVLTTVINMQGKVLIEKRIDTSSNYELLLNNLQGECI
ncbi:MAG: hypothetical protein Q8904_13970 [Bacteroidota bacterium]|nr:hypothetical protein [Bacteroidota bacterium]